VPELPEVETICRGLNQLTLNQVIWGGDVLLARTIAHPFCVGEFLARLKNVTITHWHRRGKYLLAELAHSNQTNREQEGSQESGVRRVEKSLHVHPWENNPKTPAAG